MGKQRKWTDEQLVVAVENEFSLAGVLRSLNLKVCGGNYALVKLRIKQLDLNTKHFTGQGWCKGEKHKEFIKKQTIPLEDVLVKESTYQCTYKLKKRLLSCGKLKNKCYECGLSPEWNNEPLVMQLDHIDGDRCNNEIENLRLLCPNCHNQTSTFCGKNKGKKKPE